MNQHLIASIEAAQRTVERFAKCGFGPAEAIERQLTWCWSRVAGFIQDPPPAPLRMSALAENEFAKYGAYPLLAHQLRTIELQITKLDAEPDAAFAA
ncbi:MAG: hypothetical protein ACOYMN_01790 [Roseimicrobium sp.]